MKKFLTFILFIIAGSSLLSQTPQDINPLNSLNNLMSKEMDNKDDKSNTDFEETIVTDRPDQTESPVLTPKGWFQIEVGIQREFDKQNSNLKLENTLLNTTLWKYGLTERVELRLITEYSQERTLDDKDNELTNVQGLNPFAVGLKMALQKEKGVIPEISLITHLELPYFGIANFKPQFIVPRFRFLFAHELSETFSLSYNLGGEWEDGANNSTGIYTVSLGVSLMDRLSGFVELYGFCREATIPDHRFDGGLTYLLTNDLQLDVSGGIGLNDFAPDSFISAGISYRFKAF